MRGLRKCALAEFNHAMATRSVYFGEFQAIRKLHVEVNLPMSSVLVGVVSAKSCMLATTSTHLVTQLTDKVPLNYTK